MKKIGKAISDFLVDNAPWIIVLLTGILCAIFIVAGNRADDGSITLDGKPAVIEEYTEKFIEDANSALYRIMNEDAPTDQETIDRYKDGNLGEGLGGSASLDEVKARRLPDGDNDNGLGWQCSKYTAYLATGQREYSTVHTDYGPVNGKAVAAWLVNNFGWKYIDTPVEGAIGSGGFNTQYGHTVMYLYSTGANTAMVNDANWVPLRVSTHNMNIGGYVWVVPGDYSPEPSPEPQPTPSGDTITYTYVQGDYFSKVLVNLGLDEGNLWGYSGTVNYYTNQLIDQNMLDYRGNVKLGIPFTLRKR